MYWFHLVLAIVYYGIGYLMTNIAFRFVRPERTDPTFLAIYDPANFLPEGEPARRRAVRYWWMGFAVVVTIVAISIAVSHA